MKKKLRREEVLTSHVKLEAIGENCHVQTVIKLPTVDTQDTDKIRKMFDDLHAEIESLFQIELPLDGKE